MGLTRTLRSAQVIFTATVLLAGSMVFGKKAHPADPTVPTDVQNNPAASSSGSVSGEQATMADMRGKLQLAQVKVGKVACVEEPQLASSRQKLSDMYDRQESGTQTGLSQLHSAAGDATKVTAASNAIEAAGNEVRTYLSSNPSVSSTLTHRVNIVNAELTMIAKSPASYVSLLQKSGLTDPNLSQAKTAVQSAASSSGGKVDGDTTSGVLSTRTQVRGMLSSKQAAALDTALSGGSSSSSKRGSSPLDSIPTALRPKGL